MASKEQKIVRRAQAMSNLSLLSGLLAEKYKVQLPDVNVTNRDPELAEIQRIETINALLGNLLEASKGEDDSSPPKKSVRSVKHGPVT